MLVPPLVERHIEHTGNDGYQCINISIELVVELFFLVVPFHLNREIGVTA